jgi:serine protease Do
MKNIIRGGLALLLLVLNFGVGVLGAYVGQEWFEEEATPKVQSQAPVADDSSAITKVYDATQNAVVSVIITKDVPIFKEYTQNPFEQFGIFGFGNVQREQVGTEEQQIGAGTGFFVSADGTLITNRHVVADTEASYSVILNSGDILDAEVVDIDTLYDIAVLKVKGEGFSYLELGDSDPVKVGTHVIAIGNALGEFSNTVSDGIISGLDRSLQASSGNGQTELLSNVFQTDASINSGNSGGPLLDYSGKVIGVNVAMAQGAENIGFAIPINPIQAILTSIREHGEIIRPYLGVRYDVITASLKEANKLDYDYGVLVRRGEAEDELAVVPGSPADKAGLKENDIILEVDGKKLEKNSILQQEIQKHAVGDTVTLKVSSGGKERDVQVKLEKSPF